MDEMVRRVQIPEVSPGARVAVRFEEVRHSIESFNVQVYVGRWSETELREEPDRARAMLAGLVGVYGHGDAYGSQEQLDQELAPFFAEVDLTPALARCSEPVRELTLSVVDFERHRRPPDLFRFSRAAVVLEP